MKTPTSSELNPNTDFFDFIEFDVFTPDSIGIFHQLFADHQIWMDTDRLLFDLVLVLFEVLRGPDRRSKKSSKEIHFPKNIRKAYIQRLRDSIEDPTFAAGRGINPLEVEKDIKRYEAELSELVAISSERAGQTKILIRSLAPVILRLDLNGLDRSKRVAFLHDLFVAFESPEFGGAYQKAKKAEKDRIRQWDRGATKLAESQPPIMGVALKSKKNNKSKKAMKDLMNLLNDP